METITGIIDAIPAWVIAITGLVTAASAITALTPTKKDDKVISKILSFLNLIALNVGNAKPKDD